MGKNWLFSVLFLVGISNASIEVQQFDHPQQEETYHQLIESLRCPQCQNNSIADSNATIAEDMRHKTLELLKQGKSKDEIVQYMVQRYGNFVSYDPPLTPATVLLWLMPILLLGVGGMLVYRKGQQAGHSAEKFAKDDQQRLQEILQDEEQQ